MFQRFLWALPVLWLAACGIDGAPERPAGPDPDDQGPRIVVSGDARIGGVGTF
jgi:hypothetical protein